MNLTKTIKTTACAIAVLAICTGAVNAQEAVKQDAPKPAFADVSGVLFFDYSYLLETKEKVADTKSKSQDSFNLNRAYVNVAKKIDDVWSAKVTLDAGTVENSDAFVKNAYGQMSQKFGDGAADLKVQLGLVGTPIIGLIDGLNGSRWIYQNYVDKAADITGSDLDKGSADTGLKAELNIMKMVSVTCMYSNGDGYKTNTSDQVKTTKSYYGVVNVTPINSLNIFGYYHWRDTAASDADKNFVSYYGGGAAWSEKAIKVGAAYTMRTGKAADIKEESNVMEIWANLNLQQFTQVPVLLIGRYAMGTYKKDAASELKNEGSAIWLGAGYQVNSNVQFALMCKVDALEKKTAGVKTSDTESSTLYVKSEIKF